MSRQLVREFQAKVRLVFDSSWRSQFSGHCQKPLLIEFGIHHKLECWLQAQLRPWTLFLTGMKVRSINVSTIGEHLERIPTKCSTYTSFLQSADKQAGRQEELPQKTFSPKKLLLCFLLDKQGKTTSFENFVFTRLRQVKYRQYRKVYKFGPSVREWHIQ